MAKTIDEKIVVLEFDNSNFERNTRQTMNTLDKLKEKFSFDGASKGVDQLTDSIKNVDMTKLSNGITEVQHKFSALEVVGVTALANITNSIVNTGKQLLASFTIDPVKTGWNKMSQTMGYVQTLVNSTGLSTDEVQEYLDKLVWYSDETSYSFEEMASALASMTSTGGDIKKLIPTIMGVANATAYAGKGANEFLIAIRNITQSYSAGYLQYRDWFSLKNQNVNSKQLTQELINAGVALGKIKKGQVTLGNFETTLSKRWATTAVMERAFSNFSALTTEVNKAYEKGYYYMKKANGEIEEVDYTTATKAIEDFRKGAANTASAVGKAYSDISYKALKAAQSAKTFKEAMDATKDATSSAWSRIFQVIFGNYDSQLKIFSNLANYLYDLFVEPLNKIEEKLRLTFDFHPLEDIINKINNSKFMKAFNKVNKTVTNSTEVLKRYQDVVAKVWRGDYGNMQPRWNKLNKQGYNAKVVQDLVNLTEKRAGYGKGYKVVNQLSLDDIIKSEKKYGIETVKYSEEVIEKKLKLEDLTRDQLETMQELDLEEEKRLKKQKYSLALTDEEIDQFLMLQKSAKKYRMSIDELTKHLTKYKNGARGLLFDAPELDEDEDHLNKLGIADEVEVLDKKTGQKYKPMVGAFTALLRAFKNVLKVISDAWHEIFDINAIDLYMAIEKFNKFANSLYNATKSEKGMQNLKDTLKGIFSILKLITTFAGGAFKVAFLVIKTVLKTFGYTLLDVTGAIGRVISNVVQFITENNILIDGIVWLTKILTTVIAKIYRFIWDNLHLMDIIRWVSDAIHFVTMALKNFVNGVINAKTVPKAIEFIFKSIGNMFVWLWKSIKSIDFKKIWNSIKAAFVHIELKLGEFINNIRKKAKYFSENIWPIIKDGFKTAWEKTKEAVRYFGDNIWPIIKSTLKKVAIKIYNAIVTGVPKIWAWIKETIPKIWSWLKTNIPKGLSWIEKNISKIPEFLGKIIGKTAKFISENMPKLWDIIKLVGEKVKNFIITAFSKKDRIIEIGKNIIAGLGKGISEGAGTLFESVKNVALSVINWFKELFGIHSPSVVMKYIGYYLLAGLVVGINENQGNVLKAIGGLVDDIIDKLSYITKFIPELFKTIGDTTLNIIKGLDFGRLMVGIISIGGIKAALKMADVVDALTKTLLSFKGIFDGIKGILTTVNNTIKDMSKSIKWRLYGAAFKDMAKGLLEIALAIAVLALLPAKDMWRGAAVLALAIAAIVGSLILINKFGGGEFKSSGKQFAGMALMLVAMGLAFKLMASAISTIAKIKETDLSHVVLMIGLMVSFLTSLAILSKINGTKETALVLLSLGVLFKLIANSLKSVANLEARKFEQALSGMIVIILGIKSLLYTLAFTSKIQKGGGLAGFATTLLAIGVLFLLMGKTVKMMGKLETGQLIKGLAALVVMAGLVSGLLLILSTATKGNSMLVATMGKTLLEIGVLFLLMGVTIKMVSSLSIGDIIKGSFAIALFFAMIAGFLYSVQKLDAGHEGSKAERTLIGVGVAVIGIAAALLILSMIKPKDLIAPTLVIAIVLASLALVVKAAQGIQANAEKALKIVLGMIIAVLAALVILTLVDAKRLIPPVIAIASLMGALALLMYAAGKLSKIKTKSLWEVTKKIIVLSAMLVPLIGIVYLLTQLPESSGLIQKAVSVGLLLVAMSASLYIISQMKGLDWGMVAKGVVGMLGLCVVVVALAGILLLMNNVQNAIPNAIAISMLLTVMAGVLIATSLVGIIYGATGGVAALGLVGLIALLIISAGIIQILDSFNGIKDADKNTKLLIKLLTSLTKVLTKLAKIGPLALIGDVALAGLLVVIKAFIPVLTAMSAIAKLFGTDNVTEFLDGGIKIFVKLAEGLAKIIGVFASTLLGTILVGIGRSLSQFMTEVETFIEGCRKIDDKVGYGVKVLVGAILGLTVASFIHGITSLLPIVGSMAYLGLDLSAFMLAAKGFFTGIESLDNSTLEGADCLAGTMLKIAKANVLNAISSLLGLGSKESLSSFGDSLGALGTGLKEFKDNLGSFDDTDVATVECAAKALDKLANAQSNMRTTGGFLQWLIGEKESLKTFGSGLKDVGGGIRGFITELTKGNGKKKFTKEDMEVVESGAKVIKTLADAANDLPETWSLKGWLLGGNQEDLNEFAAKFPTVAAAIRSFIANLTKSGLEKEYKDFVTAEGNIAESAKATIVAFKITEDMKPVVDIAIQVLQAIASLSGSIKDVSSDAINKVVDLIPVIGQNLKKLIYALLEFDSPVGPNGPVKIDTTKANSLLNKDNMELIKNAVGAFKTICEGLKEILSPNGTNVDASLISIGGSGSDLPDPEDLQEIIEVIPSIGVALRKFIAALTDPNYGLLGAVSQMPLVSGALKKAIDESDDGSDNTINMEFITNMVDVFSSLCQALTGFIDEDSDVPDPDDFKEFIETFEDIGKNIRKFIDALYNGSDGFKSIAKEFTKDDVTSLTGLFTGVGDLLSTVKEVASQNEVENNNMKTFFTNLSGFGKNIAAFIADAMNLNKDEIQKATSNMGLLKTLFDAYITNVIKPATQTLVTDNKESIDALKSEGISFITKFSEGISDKTNLEKLYATIKGYGLEGSKHLYDAETSIQNNVKQMGINFIQGFTTGLGNQKAIENMKTQCANLGHIAYETTKSNLKERSPSKLSMEIGSYFTEGLAIGIGSTANMVYEASNNVGELAKTGLQEAVASISSLIENDMDMQPTIRPVLDLTDVQSGIYSMNSMFNNSQIGALSNLRTINSEMNSRNQNGRTSDVVSAINKLGKSIDDTPKTTYNINGITYDGDSSVNAAVQQLINAIEVERRV